MLDITCLDFFAKSAKERKNTNDPIKLRAANLLHQIAKATLKAEEINNTVELPAILEALAKSNGYTPVSQDDIFLCDDMVCYSQEDIKAIIRLLQPLSMQCSKG